MQDSGSKVRIILRTRMFRNCMIRRNREFKKVQRLLQGKINKLTSVFHASVLLLIMNFVLTLSK